MKNLVDILNSNNIVLKTIEKIDLVKISSRQKINLFSGVNEAKYYVAIFVITNKSRFIKSNALKLIELEERLEVFMKHTYKNRLLVISSPLCLKAKSFLKENRWKIIEVQDVIV